MERQANSGSGDFAERLSAAFKAVSQAPIRQGTLCMRYGQASAGALAATAAGLPKGSFLLYLHPPCGPAEAEALRRAAPGFGAVAEELSMGGTLRERVFAIMDLVRPQDASLSIDPGLHKGSEALVSWLRAAVSDGFEKNNIMLRTCQARMRCALANLDKILGGGRQALPSIDPSTPVLICGSGPSISSQLEAIAAAKPSAAIVCAGRSAEIFSKAGVKPDFVVDIEQVSHLYWPDSLRMDCPLVAHEAVSPAATASFERFVWIDSGRSPVAKLLKECGVELPGIATIGPVACIMIGFAVACGARRVGLCGFDLSISPSGKSYADEQGSLDMGDPGSALEIPGVNGGMVKTLPQFEFMRRDVEATIDRLMNSAGPSLSIFNCSPSGAAIAGTKPLPLQGFLSLPELGVKSVALNPAPKAERLSEKLAAALAGVDKSLSTLGSVTKGLRRLCAALEGPGQDLAKAASLEKALMAAFKEEQEARASGLWTEFSSTACEQARMLVEQGPKPQPPKTQAEARLAHYSRLKLQCMLHEDLLSDLRDDLRELSRAVAEGRRPKIDPLLHPGLRRHSLRRVAELNPPLAELLSKTKPGSPPEGFEVMPKLLSPPIVLSMKLSDGSLLKFAAAADYMDETKAAVSEFLAKSSFDPASCAVLFVGHPNWGAVSETSFRHPFLQCAVLFPWAGLLSHMADVCEFIGLIPADAPLLCPLGDGKDWLEPLRAKAAVWKAQGRRVLLFGDARTGSLPEVSSARDEALKALGAL